MFLTSTHPRTILLGGLIAMTASASPQPQKAFGASVSNVKKPSQMFGATLDGVSRRLGGAPNATIKDSGWSLNLILQEPVASEAVWAYDLTDPVPLCFTRESWIIGDPRPRTVRMYYHMGFDTNGRAIAGCMWFHGPTSAGILNPGPGRPGTPPPTRPTVAIRDPNRGENPIPPPTYWNYSLPTLISQYYDVQEAKFSFWRAPFSSGDGKPGRFKKCELIIYHETPAKRSAREPYYHIGWIMGEGSSGNSNWYSVGRHYLVTEDPRCPSIEIDGNSGGAFGVTDMVLFLEIGKHVKPVRGKIVPATNDQATKQNGVK